jgi:hypothetical protein
METTKMAGIVGEKSNHLWNEAKKKLTTDLRPPPACKDS